MQQIAAYAGLVAAVAFAGAYICFAVLVMRRMYGTSKD